MSKAGDVTENPVTGERVVVRVGTEDSGGELLASSEPTRPAYVRRPPVASSRPNAAPTLAVARGDGLDRGDVGEVVHGRASSMGAIGPIHPVTVSFVGKHTLRILRSGGPRKSGLPMRQYWNELLEQEKRPRLLRAPALVRATWR